MPKTDEKELKEKEKPGQQETETKEKLTPEIGSDRFNADDRKAIIKMVKADVEYAKQIHDDYIAQKALDLKHYHCEKPSVLENLDKDEWMSDRNLGLARAVADSYQAVLLATCWNPDSINFKANRVSEIDNRNNKAKFTKWGMGQQEANMEPEVDSFIHNRIVTGTSFFKVYRKISYEWVDKRTPIKDKNGKTVRYKIETVKVKKQKGLIENVPDIDDILMPAYGKDIQELPFFIQRLHLDGETVTDYLDREVFKPANVEEYKKKLYNFAYAQQERDLGEEKLEELGIKPTDYDSNDDVRRLDITAYEWYGYYTKNGRHERFRMIVDLENEEFLSGKPLRKINRSGKIPYAGGGLYQEPGQIRSDSLMKVIAPVVNAFNNVFNQKSDFQYVTNCPFGFNKPEEGYTKQEYKLKPGVLYPSDDPSKINFPNLQRSMAWAESDMRILFELLERLTGAASYFNVAQRQNQTLGQDLLVDQQSQTRFGLWVKRIIRDICAAIDLWFELYQDYPPEGLAERVLGIDGKQIFTNLSVDSLSGDDSVQMSPDPVSGSKMYSKQLQEKIYAVGSSMIWLNPQLNPAGNWKLCADTLKEMRDLSDSEVKGYIGEPPKAAFDKAELENEWTKFLNGEDFAPPEGESALAIQHLQGHALQKEEKFQDLPDEYKPLFEAHYFKTMVNAMRFMRNLQREQVATQLAASVAVNNPQPAQPGAGPGSMPAQAMPSVNPQPLIESQPTGAPV